MTEKPHSLIGTLLALSKAEQYETSLVQNFNKEVKVARDNIEQLEDQVYKFKHGNARVAAGETYFSTIDAKNTATMSLLVDAMLQEVNSGDLINMVDENLHLVYEWDSGFGSGDVRLVKRGYGSRYATTTGQITLSNDIYDKEITLTDDAILSMLSYLEELKKSLNHYTGSAKPGDIVVSKRDNLAYTLISSWFGEKEGTTLYIKKSDNHRVELNDWLAKFYNFPNADREEADKHDK